MGHKGGIKGILRLAAKVFVLAVAICITVAAIGLWLFFPEEKIRTTLAQELSKAIDHAVRIDSVSIGLYPDLEFVARDVAIIDVQTSQKIVSAQKVRLDMNLRKLLKKEYSIENVTVIAPELELSRDSNGKWNVESLIERLGRSGRSQKDEQSSESPPVVEIGPIGIRHGTAHVRDAQSGVRVDATRVEAIVDLENDSIRFDSASILLPPFEAKASGSVSHVSKPNPIIEIKTAMRVRKGGPLKNFGSALIPANTILAEISAKASGPLDELAIESDYSINRLVTSGIPTKGTLAGILKPEEGVLNVSSLGISFGKSRASFSGTASNILSNKRAVRLDGRIYFLLEDALAVHGSKSLSKFEPSGAISGPVALKNFRNRVNIKANLDLKDAGMTVPGVMRKQPGSAASLVFDAACKLPDEVVVDNYELLLAGAKVAGKARMNPGASPWAQATVTTSNFPLKVLDDLSSFDFEEGSLTLAAEVWQAHRGDKHINHKGTASVTKVTVSTDWLKEPATELDANLQWDNQKAIVESASFLFAKSRHSGRAQIIGFDKPRVTGTIHTDTLDIEGIAAAIGKKEGEIEENDDNGEGSDFSVELQIEADSMQAGKLKTGPLITKWRATPEVHSFSPIQLSVFGGNLDGSYELRPSEGSLRWVADFEGKNMKLEDVMAQIGQGATKARGLLTVKGNLEGTATGGREKVTRSLGGNLQVKAREGEIMEYSLLKKIFMFTQVPVGPSLLPGFSESVGLKSLIGAAKTAGLSLDPTRVSFSRIDGDFRISNGVAHTDDLRFESVTLDLICKGDIDISKSVMDMRVRATPLGLVSSLMGKVPIAGGTLKGAKEAVFSTDFVARGPISNPDVGLEAVDKLLPGQEKN